MASFNPLRAFARLILTRRVLHHDDKVLVVNESIAIMTNWPADPELHPHPFAKLLRNSVTVFSYLVRKSKDAITPINLWMRQHIIHYLSLLAKGVVKLTLDAFGRVKFAFCSLLGNLKHLCFKNPNSILLDVELRDNHVPEETDDRVPSNGVLKVIEAVDEYISLLDKTFAVQYHQPHFRRRMDEWKGGAYVCSFLPGSSPLMRYG